MDLNHTSELCAAVNAGDAARVRLAIDSGGDIDSGITRGVKAVPIILAAMNGHTDCLRLLIEAGASIEAEGASRETAAMWAAITGHQECLALLIAAGANVNAQDVRGMTVAMWAAKHRASNNTTCLNLLISAGADLRQTDSMRRSAAAHAKTVGKPEMAAFIKEHIAALDERKRLAKTLRTKPSKAQVSAFRM